MDFFKLVKIGEDCGAGMESGLDELSEGEQEEILRDLAGFPGSSSIFTFWSSSMVPECSFFHSYIVLWNSLPGHMAAQPKTTFPDALAVMCGFMTNF